MTALNGKNPEKERWVLYVLECSDGTFYTGITNNLDRRMHLHNSGSASRYTRSRLPVTLIHHEHCRSRSQALKRELAVKSLSRKEKEEYINMKNCAAAKSPRRERTKIMHCLN